jgi:hypothetical protein
VCPSAPTQFSVVVSDSSGTGQGETAQQSQVVEADGRVDCTSSDAGDAGDAGLTSDGLIGCKAINWFDADGGFANSATECFLDEVEAGAAWIDGGAVTSDSVKLPFTLKAGHPYEFTSDRFIPISVSLSQPATVEVWGAAHVCVPRQKLFSVVLDWPLGMWHQSFCFTPLEDFDQAVVRVFIQGVIVNFSLLQAQTLCSGCGM